ncbi:ATP-dependent DNA helicase [Mangrovitalea sediminis]|uniref:ATP-dependent DNA helicase n=1 Tax=Mangrovitalea sediminis TaxID=1982043 RepID=UPI0018E94093|nr:ATP-dependent DNA helicase [Mangrovitalea sediminis]
MSAYHIAVRALCEFTAKQGDLDLRFTPSPSAQEGIAGHAAVQAKRWRDYEAELPLKGDYGLLEVRGRADGYDPARNQLEEIKTFRGELERQPENHRLLHWAQAKVYGWLLCQERGLDGVWVALVYYDIVRQKETVIREWHDAESLHAFFDDQCQRFLAWAKREMAHREARDQALTTLRFPHPDFRDGQRPLAEAVYKAACAGRPLMIEAPTGIGKTIGTLFPQLKAMPGQKLDKIFYLAAKTPGRQLALDALKALRQDSSAPPRVVELIARDKACEHPDKACHGESCPLARGFYDRLPAAREAALDGRQLDQLTLRAVALEHGICPYYLSQELVRWADVVVGDYNYYFDLSALLYALTEANQWRVALLVDEAHNLVDRARGMYSAGLDQARFRHLRRTLPATLKRPFDSLNRAWNALYKDQTVAYETRDELPQRLLDVLQRVIAALTDEFTENPANVDSELQRVYFDLIHFGRIAELFDRHFLFDISLQPGQRHRTSTLNLRNLVPAPVLRERFEAAHTATLFSATLTPRHYYQDLLGLPENCTWLSVDSPFQADQLSVHLVSRISTRYRHRAASVAPIVQLMADHYATHPGNYLAFFSSFEYLDQVADALENAYPALPVWRQSPRMDEEARRAFLARFTEGGRGIGFAVLGGAFGEGIDLPGERLVGAFIATLGLPPLNPVNEQFEQRLQAIFGHGYDYTYLFPGLQKVIQAAGRVIRTQSDRGEVFLIDDRFRQPRIRALLPRWWHPQVER